MRVNVFRVRNSEARRVLALNAAEAEPKNPSLAQPFPKAKHHEMASSAAVRSFFRSCSSRSSAFRIASEAKATRSPFRIASRNSLSHSTVRCPVELSFCVESMLPYHTATASALMTSMLSVSRTSCGWLPDECNDDV